MNATTKKILIVVLFLIAGGISFYAYVSNKKSSVDVAVSERSEEYTCPHCGGVFNLTIAEATQMRRSQGAIVCKQCGEKGASKEIEFSIGGMGGGSTASDWGEEDEEDDVVEVKQPRRTSGGMRKKDP